MIENHDQEKKEKIDDICRDLLEKLSNIKDWSTTGEAGVSHKEYNLETHEHIIIRPSKVRIPWKWRRKIRYQIKRIFHQYEMESLNFLHDVILDKYPLQVRALDEERREWLKENSREGDYIADGYWYYFENESLAVAYKLRWM